jgi:DMSO/TMAO reductase YedYZ molybdopterin-dependent catalytic subunit
MITHNLLMKQSHAMTRRQMIKGSVALAALAFAHSPLRSFGFKEPEQADLVLPFLDPQPVGKMLRWEQLTDWITPTAEVFHVQHYGVPEFDAEKWQLDISGLVKKPRTLTLAGLKALKRTTLTATLECSGNGSGAGFMGAIGNVRWTGTRLAPLLEECGPLKRGIEVVFFGVDEKVEKIREKDYTQHFARSLAISDALRDEVLLAYEMNGEPLTKNHGAPVRLIVPGWFGIAWVKWLTRIEVIDRRYMSKYMAREYVTIRGEERDGTTIWRETSVGPIDVKSIVARAVRRPDGTVRFSGAAWTDGTPLKTVEVKINDGKWLPASLEQTQASKYSWTFFNFDWKNPAPGEHTVVSRAIDREGRAQPASDDSQIKLKRTYWEANQQWPRKIRLVL